MSEPIYTHVMLVVDPDFGQRAKNHAKLYPLWVIKSPRNTPVIEWLWANETSPWPSAPTVFDAVSGRTAEDSAVAFIGTVDDHHPDWQTFEVVGVPLSQKLLDAMHECASGSAAATATGFIFTREPRSVA
ncbi:MAG: hypothetical protein WDN08_08920 [Rhizomicrobium sp.]